MWPWKHLPPSRRLILVVPRPTSPNSLAGRVAGPVGNATLRYAFENHDDEETVEDGRCASGVKFSTASSTSCAPVLHGRILPERYSPYQTCRRHFQKRVRSGAMWVCWRRRRRIGLSFKACAVNPPRARIQANAVPAADRPTSLCHPSNEAGRTPESVPPRHYPPLWN